MSDVVSKVIVSLTDGTIQPEGSEAFVREQLTLFMDLIKDRLKAVPVSSPKPKSETPASPTEKPNASTGLAQYEHLFAEKEDGKIQLLKAIPGSRKAEKAVNAALLLAFANELNGVDTTTSDAIRDLCQLHGCLDRSNFAKTIQAEHDAFIVSGKRKKVVKLTKPGQTRAKALADSLNTAAA